MGGKGSRGEANTLLAGNNLGELLLINLEQKGGASHSQGGGASGKATYLPYKVERRFGNQNIMMTQRQCNAVSWNPLQRNLVVAGYEQSKNQEHSCLLVWDLN